MRIFLPLAIMVSFAAGNAEAKHDPASAMPKYETLRFDKINMHAGPGRQYPVLWVYQRKGLPVEILASYDVWKKISDPEGTIGWVQDAMLSDHRGTIVTGVRRGLLSEAHDGASLVAYADPGSMARVVSCAPDWCRLRFDDYEGFMKMTGLWGIDPGETIGK